MGLRFLALACLVGAAFAGPVQRQSESRCAKECNRQTHTKFRFEPGKAYVYKIQTENNITVTGVQKQNASIHALAEFHLLSHCEGILRVKNVRIHQKVTPEEREELKTKLEIPLRYAYQDGKFHSVCPSSKESTQSLNFKKALISSMVNEMPNIEKPVKMEEKDSFGKCLTDYTVMRVNNKGEVEITKEKNLKTCDSKKIFLNFLEKKLPTSSIFENSYMKCKQHVKNGIFSDIQCFEKQKMKSLQGKSKELVEFLGKLSLTHLQTKPAEHDIRIEPIPSHSEDILFSLSEPRPGDSNVKGVEQVLKSICSKNKIVIDMAIGKDYIKLVSLVRSLSYEELDKIYESLKDGTLCDSKKVRDIFADTLPVVATDPAIKLMVKILLNKDATALKSKYWPASLALRQNPTEETIAAILPLLERNSQCTSTLIGITSLVHRLCSSEDCDKMEAVKEVIKIYNKNLGSRCSSDNENQIVTALRAFGNMGYHGEAHQNILACAQDKSKSKRIRLLAITSFRRSHMKRPEEFIQMSSDKNEDDEIRIELLRSIFEHPDKEQLRQIKGIVETETKEQVSGYVYTLLQNINQTQIPRRQKTKGLFQDIEIHPRKVDYWTNSKNIEFSTFNEALKVGGSVETDIIHGEKTKVPISLRNRMDLHLLGNDYNVFEWGVTTEGLEDIVQKLLLLKDKIPKFEEIRDRLAKKPTLEEIKDEFNYLSPSKVFADIRSELSMYFRTLDTEVFEASTNDLSYIRELLQAAELMSKLAHGEKADFSHSVVLMNSKLTIPSVTGRSYSIDMVGSSTVGVTAEAKADFLKLPRHADVHFHFQPSVNVEFSTTVGLQSSSHRPDLKVLSRVHMESDVDARFHVKDGHAALLSFTLPSENVALINMSTSFFEIDEHNNEKPVFEKMEKKIDHCIRHLEKPLGVTACAVLEVAKPFVTKKFPYIMPFGNGEIALKKSDKSFKSYEFRVEIPKQAGPSMKYRASFDTPGSNVSRRFAADLEVKQEKDHKGLLLELRSPFETVGGSCSLTKNDKLIEGSMELHTGKRELASANITSTITVSRSRRIYEISGAYSIRNQEPARIDGTVTVIKGRKEHFSIDFRTNKSQTEPIALKATVMKEGRMEFSEKSEWKLSSEVSLKSPHGDFKLRKTLEKRHKQSKSLSANVGLDYQLKGKKKESLTLSGSSQKSSNKVNTIVKVVSTQYPRGNIDLTWDMQKESPDSQTNQLTLTNGQKKHKPYLYLKQKSHMPKNGTGYCSVTIEIPPRDIHYELSVTHDVKIGEQPRIHIEADLCYKQDKHIKSIVDINYESVRPLKGSGRVELDLPGGHYILEDEVEEKNGVIEGRSKLQYRKGKEIQIHYKYKKLSNDSKIHHEIESSIQTPYSRSPINGKASIELNSESLSVVGQVGPHYAVQANLKDDGVSHFNIKLPMIEGIIKSTEEDKKKTVDVDVKLKTQRPRHIIGSMIAESGEKKRLELRIQPDVDHAPEKKIVLSTVVEKKSRDSKDIFVSASRVQILDLLDVSLAEEGEVSLFGCYEFALETSIKNQEPVNLKFKRETGDEHGKITIEVAKNHVKKAKVEMDSKLNKNGLSIETSITSPDHSFEDVHIFMKNLVTRSGSSKTVQTALSFKKSDKVYKTEWNSDIQPNGLEVKAQMQTPHENYEKNAVGFSIQVSDNAISSSISIDCLDKKKITIQTEFKTKNHACSFVGKLSSPFEIAKEAQLQVNLDNHRNKKSVEAYIDINNARICDIQGMLNKSSEEIQVEGSFKVSNLPKVKFQGLDVKLHRSPSYALASGNIQLMNNKEISLVSEIKEEGAVIYTTTTISTPYKNFKDIKAHLSIEIQPSKRSLLCYLDKNGERKGDAELSIATSSKDVEVKGRLKTVHTPEISTHVKCEKTGESISISANIMKGTAPLLSTSFNKLSYQGGEKLLMMTKSFEDTLLDLEISKDVSEKNSNKYSLKIKGPLQPISITFSKNQNDKNSVSTELRACREVQPSNVCYSLKSYHKNLINSENYRFYQKVTMDLEKSEGGSFSKPVGRVHVLLTAAENDYRSKVTLEVNEKKLGYEMKLHSRQHENDRCSLDSYIYLPKRVSRVRASILHNHHRVNFEVDAIPNTDDPTHKLGLEVKKEINPDNREVSGYIKLSHPRMSQPLLLTCKLQPVGGYLVKGKLVLHTGPVWGKTLMIEALPNLDQEAYGIRSMEYKLYTGDKSIDAYLKLVRQSSRSEEKFAYNWKYISHDEEKKGGMTLVLSDKNGGKPNTLKLSFFSPSVNYEVQGSVAQGPEDIHLSLLSAGQKLKEIRISLSDSCANIEVTKSGPLIKSHICVNRREGSALQLLKVDMQYRQHKCLDILLGLDPEKPDYIDVVLKCSQEKACQALKEMISLKSLKELKQNVHDRVRHIKQHVVDPHVRKVRKSLKDLMDDISSKVRSKLNQHEKVVKEYVRKLKEAKETILNRIKSSIPSSVRESCMKLYQNYHELAIRYYQRVLRYWSSICEAGWYCTEIKSAFRRFEASEIKMQVDRKINEIKHSLRLRMIWPSDIFRYIGKAFSAVGRFITNTISAFQRLIIRMFGRVVGKTIMIALRRYVHKFEDMARKKAVELLDDIFNKIHHIVSQDEDLRTAKDLILDAKNEIIKAWRNREEIADASMRRMESNAKRNLKEVMDNFVQVLKYDPDEGEIRLKIRQPLSKDEIENVKQNLHRFARKLREHLHR